MKIHQFPLHVKPTEFLFTLVFQDTDAEREKKINAVVEVESASQDEVAKVVAALEELANTNPNITGTSVDQESVTTEISMYENLINHFR